MKICVVKISKRARSVNLYSNDETGRKDKLKKGKENMEKIFNNVELEWCAYIINLQNIQSSFRIILIAL